MNHVIITISREYCSGGRLIGAAVAKELDIPFYDRQLIEMAAEKSGLSPEFIENNENQRTSSFLYGLATGGQLSGAYLFDTPVGDRAFFAQAAVIRELAAKGSCVILGRCAGYILRDDPGRLNVFLHAPLENRLKLAREIYGMTGDDLEERILRVDKARRSYHKNYTGESWNDVRNYNLTIDTSKAGINGSIQAILGFVKNRE